MRQLNASLAVWAWAPVRASWTAVATAACWHACASTPCCQLVLWRAAVLVYGAGSACSSLGGSCAGYMADVAEPPGVVPVCPCRYFLSIVLLWMATGWVACTGIAEALPPLNLGHPVVLLWCIPIALPAGLCQCCRHCQVHLATPLSGGILLNATCNSSSCPWPSSMNSCARACLAC